MSDPSSRASTPPRHRVPLQHPSAGDRPSPAGLPLAPVVPRQRRPVEDAPPPVRRTRAAMAVPLVLGLAAVLGAAAAGSSLALRQTDRTTHAITAPGVVAGMPRDEERERRMREQVQPVRDAFEIQFMGRLDTFVDAVYVRRDDAPGRPRGPIVFVGATVDSSGESKDFVTALEQSAAQGGYTAVVVDAGPGARGACLRPVNTDAAASCAWSTGDSVGQVVPTKGLWGVQELAGLMRDVRAGTETSTTVPG